MKIKWIKKKIQKHKILLSFALYYHTKKCYLWLRIFFLLDNLQILLFQNSPQLEVLSIAPLFLTS